jgi:hypothetical protein
LLLLLRLEQGAQARVPGFKLVDLHLHLIKRFGNLGFGAAGDDAPILIRQDSGRRAS